jgi:imidazolonepropionase-like amidohydrolase
MIAIKGAIIYTMDEKGIIKDGTVIIDGGKILALGSNLAIPSGCDIVHAAGDYIFPGFIDAHNHIGLEEEIYGTAGSDVNESLANT